MRNAVGKFSCAGIFILALALAGCVTQLGEPTAEYRLKAADLFNFGQFVEWPPSTFPNSKSPLVIGILGGNPFGNELVNLAQKEAIIGHPVVVRRLMPFSDLSQCQILFIDHSVTSRLPLIFAGLDGDRAQPPPVLTVGETDDFLKQGGMINFVTEKDRMRFEIAPATAQKAGLKMSSQLLTMAIRLKK